MPFFSIIIPTYNQSFFLKKCLKSLISQSFTNWEAIIINNSSTDNTQEIVLNFEEKRFKLHNITNNGIIALSRNFGIKKSSGDFICFLDSDDFWYLNKLEEVYNITQLGYDLICHSEDWYKNNQYKKTLIYKPNKPLTYERLLFLGNRFSTSAVTVRSSLLRNCLGFNESNKIIGVDDYDLWLRLMKRDPKLYFIEKPLGIYLIHENNTSKRAWKQFIAEINVLNIHFAKIKYKNIYVNFLICFRFLKAFNSLLKQVILHF